MIELSEEEAKRRDREMKAALEQIKSYNKKNISGWRLDIPVWKMAIEGLVLFMLAFLVGLGFAVLYQVI